MLSGGNHYDVSHFGAAAKWFWGWIPDSSVIVMQPEGSTPACPTCLREGSFRLRPFDDKDLPPAPGRAMAVHVPLAHDGDRTLYSFWFSYRGAGNDGSTARGLSVHFATFLLREHMYGAEYDSHRYYAEGDTLDKREALVAAGTCYAVHPSAYLKDRDLAAAAAVRPVVCVDAVDEGSSIDISVSFVDGESLPPAPAATAEGGGLEVITLECSGGASPVATTDYVLNARDSHLIHVINTGYDADISLSLCTDDGSASDVQARGFLYDEYVGFDDCSRVALFSGRRVPISASHVPFLFAVACVRLP